MLGLLISFVEIIWYTYKVPFSFCPNYDVKGNSINIKLSEKLKIEIKKSIRKYASPRHVPNKLIQIGDIPRTKNGKIVEEGRANLVFNDPKQKYTAQLVQSII